MEIKVLYKEKEKKKSVYLKNSLLYITTKFIQDSVNLSAQK